MSGLITRNSLTYSAILCTFNSKSTVSESLESIFSQSVEPVDIVVVDDSSTDGTFEILETAAKVHSNLKLVRNPKNLGQAAARNIAANIAGGEILILFDDDDTSNTNRAREHMRMHESGVDFSFVSSAKTYENQYRVNCPNKRKIDLTLDPTIWIQKLTLGQAPKLLDDLWVPACTASILKESFLSLGGFDPSFRRLEDIEIFIRACQAGFSSSWSPDILVMRKATFSDSKGSSIETAHERKLLMKHKHLLQKNTLKKALFLIDIREAYFTQGYFRIILVLLLNPIMTLKSIFRIKRLVLRILHDIKKSN